MKQKVPMIMWDEDAAIYNYREICKLSRKLETSEETVAVLTRLVERMGCDLNTFWWGDNMPDYPYTIIGQREWQAAQHDAEGAPPDAGMLEAVQ